ncbi:thioredoxin domain-containing protein 3 homolog isoform X6 [Ptychodera flava]|uniref:thioredoxin domain-containing protein 3 homolog isoform X6 n=1 Tax=Ptychodera flava TaxID=63121 RepID=UPI00396A8FEA
MPPKREAIALQKEVLNQEQWDEIMAAEGITVVDVYQKWCGPCKAVASLFKRVKNEIGDDLLHFAVAEADGIESLEKYRGHCEPCFLFFGGGQLVHVIRGAKAPALAMAITDQLTAEHKVLEEGAERKVVRDPLLAAKEEEEKAAEMAAEEEKRKQEEEALKPKPKQVTVAVIKPDAVKAGHVDEIVEKMKAEGLEILAQEERMLTEDEARDFYSMHKDEEHFEELVQFMASGPVHTLILTKGDTGEGVVPEVRTLIGPADVSKAKEEAPDSLRAVYGTDTITNAVHAADSDETAARELGFFFPNYSVPTVPGTGPPPKKERTLAIIRPDALREHKDAIIDKVQEAGFEIALQKEIQLTEDQAKEFYKEHEGQEYFDGLVANMTSGPVLVLGLAREDAIQTWRDMLGPKIPEEAKQNAPDSLRAQFSVEGLPVNTLHGSDSPEQADKELNYFFPVQQTLAVIKPEAVDEHKEAIMERIKEAGFNIAVSKETQLTKELAEQLYKEHDGKEFYQSLVDHMASGPSMVMVLSREDAVTGFREIMGPTDPEVAKEQAPESLRALLGKDILQNAIHASSNPDQASHKIKEFFPDVEFNPDGTVKGEEGEDEDEEGKDEEDEEEEAEGEKPAEGENGEVHADEVNEGEAAPETQDEGKVDEKDEGADVEGEQVAEEADQQKESEQQEGHAQAETDEQKAEEPAAEGKDWGDLAKGDGEKTEEPPKEETAAETTEGEGAADEKKEEEKGEDTSAPAEGEEAKTEEQPAEGGENKQDVEGAETKETDA